MRKVTIGASLFVLLLCAASATAQSGNWVSGGTFRAIGGSGTFYIDQNSVVKNGDHVIFWVMLVWDQEEPWSGAKKFVEKEEAILSNPRQIRQLEVYHYDRENKEFEHSAFPLGYHRPTTNEDPEIDLALKYAKEGKDTGPHPTP